MAAADAWKANCGLGRPYRVFRQQSQVWPRCNMLADNAEGVVGVIERRDRILSLDFSSWINRAARPATAQCLRWATNCGAIPDLGRGLVSGAW